MEYIKVTNNDDELAVINIEKIAYIEDLDGASLVCLTDNLGTFKVKESIESLVLQLDGE